MLSLMTPQLIPNLLTPVTCSLQSTKWLSLLQAVTASSTASTTPRRVAFLPEKHVDFIFSIKPEPSIFSICLVLVLFVIAVTLYYVRIRRRQRRDTIS